LIFFFLLLLLFLVSPSLSSSSSSYSSESRPFIGTTRKLARVMLWRLRRRPEPLVDESLELGKRMRY
jgi:hypothetical protein